MQVNVVNSYPAACDSVVVILFKRLDFPTLSRRKQDCKLMPLARDLLHSSKVWGSECSVKIAYLPRKANKSHPGISMPGHVKAFTRAASAAT